MPKPSQKDTASETAQRCLEATEKLIKLIARLEMYRETPPPEGYKGNVDRARFIALQEGIGRFLGSLGCKDIEREFFRLASYLHDLDSGIVSDVFRPTLKSKGGRNLDAYQVWLARAGIAAALECFSRGEEVEEATAKRLAKRKKDVEALLRSGTKSFKDAALNWLKQFKRRAVAPPAMSAWETYADLIEKFNRKGVTSPEWLNLGNSFLNAACKQARRLRFSAHSKKSNPPS
jgi:hypothetical protein